MFTNCFVLSKTRKGPNLSKTQNPIPFILSHLFTVLPLRFSPSAAPPHRFPWTAAPRGRCPPAVSDPRDSAVTALSFSFSSSPESGAAALPRPGFTRRPSTGGESFRRQPTNCFPMKCFPAALVQRFSSF
ncbi:unnamed protein product [Citrullus colocynthis]|uniref:Uncharacterized protein n=1 Tax=Citrullus colocynthis TaxID=252529 RepID=A0ABP0YZK1_9ROSI